MKVVAQAVVDMVEIPEDDADTRAAEEMADSMLWDSPIPETEEEKK